MDQRDRDLEYLENQGLFTAEQAKNLVSYKEKLNRRYFLPDELVNRAEEDAKELLREIEKTRQDSSATYARFYEYEFHLGKSAKEEGMDLVDAYLNPNPQDYEVSESLVERVARVLVLYNLGFIVDENPPHSVEKDQMRQVKGINTDNGTEVYYVASPFDSNLYHVRTARERAAGYVVYKDSLEYAPPSEEFLRRIHNLPQVSVPARA